MNLAATKPDPLEEKSRNQWTQQPAYVCWDMLELSFLILWKEVEFLLPDVHCSDFGSVTLKEKSNNTGVGKKEET
jgi:hypothetical protein